MESLEKSELMKNYHLSVWNGIDGYSKGEQLSKMIKSRNFGITNKFSGKKEWMAIANHGEWENS